MAVGSIEALRKNRAAGGNANGLTATGQGGTVVHAHGNGPLAVVAQLGTAPNQQGFHIPGRVLGGARRTGVLPTRTEPGSQSPHPLEGGPITQSCGGQNLAQRLQAGMGRIFPHHRRRLRVC